MTDAEQGPQPHEAATAGREVWASRRPSPFSGLRWGVVTLLVAWTALLFVVTWVLPVLLRSTNAVSYNHYGAVRNYGYAFTTLLAVLGPLCYVAPVVVGAFARTWRGALAFTLVPLWLVQLPTVGAGFAGSISGPLIFGAGQGQIQVSPALPALWLDPSRGQYFLIASGIFALLGTIGWLARTAWMGDLRRA